MTEGGRGNERPTCLFPPVFHSTPEPLNPSAPSRFRVSLGMSRANMVAYTAKKRERVLSLQTAWQPVGVFGGDDFINFLGPILRVRVAGLPFGGFARPT